MMIAENRYTQAARRLAIIAILLLCSLAAMAEDVTFMTNRRQWEKLPTLTLMNMGGRFLDQRMMPDSALLCWSIVVNRYNENMQERDLHNCIRAYHHISDIYSDYYHNQAEAYRYLLKSKDLAEKHHYDTYMPDILMTLGNLYWRQMGLLFNNDQCYKEALAYHKSAFWKAIEVHNNETLPLIMLNLNYASCVKNDLPLTDKERETFARMALPDTIRNMKISLTINQGVRLLAKKQHEQALEVFRNAYDHAADEFEGTNVNSIKSLLNNFIVYTQIQMRNPDVLQTILKEKVLTEKVSPEYNHETYGQLSMYYRTFNNQPLADKYELMWWRATDSVAQAYQANNVNTIRFLHEIDKMNEEQKALTLKQQHDRQMLWVVSGFLALALGLIVLLVINRGLIKQKNRVLYENNVALLAAEDEHRRLAEQEEQTRIEAEAVKYGAIRMDEQSTEELWQNIIHVMEYSQEIYDENFTEPRLAELIGAKYNYVSQAINQQKDWTFSSLVTHYRIREACRRMNDTDIYGNYTVEGIGQSVGYSSRSHFVKLFKKHTGLTPSDYMKQCRAGTPPEVILRPHPLSTSVPSP